MEQNKLHVKRDDLVQIIAGKDKGKTGRVLKSLPAKNRVIVEGVNMIKKHQRPNQQNQQGGIIEMEAPIHVSNVMVVCPGCKQPSRVGHKVIDGRKIRYCKKCNESVDK